MDVDMGVGVIVGLIIASCLFIYNSESFTKSQKTVLLILFVFFPAQWLGIIIVLIYNSIQANNSTEKVHERKVEQVKTKLNSSISDLKDLKEKGILTESEYNEKVAKIKTEQTQQNIENSLEYKQLKGLLNSEILTKEEFESKIETLQKNNNFQTVQFNESNILGLYIVDGIKYKFDSKSKLTVTNKRGTIFNERWYLQPNNIIKVKVGLFTTTFKDIEIDKDGFSYTNSKTKYYAKRTL